MAHFEKKKHEDHFLHSSSESSMIDGRNRIISASVATVIAETLIAPTNIIKERQMSFAAKQTTQFLTIKQVVKDAVNQEGYKSFFHGFPSTIFKQIGEKSLVLLSYDPIRNQLSNWRTKWFSSSPTSKIEESDFGRKVQEKVQRQSSTLHLHHEHSNSMLVCLLSGGISGMVGYSIIPSPTMLPLSRINVQHEEIQSPFNTTAEKIKNVSTGPIRFLSRSNLMHVFLIYSIEFGGYDYLKTYIMNYSDYATSQHIWPIYVLSASTVGIISAFISVPADILCARSMNEMKNPEGIISYVRNKINEEGKTAFRKRLLVNMTRKVVWLSGFFLTYEEARHYLNINYSNSQIMYD